MSDGVSDSAAVDEACDEGVGGRQASMSTGRSSSRRVEAASAPGKGPEAAIIGGRRGRGSRTPVLWSRELLGWPSAESTSKSN